MKLAQTIAMSVMIQAVLWISLGIALYFLIDTFFGGTIS